jgi:hypothetical protein
LYYINKQPRALLSEVGDKNWNQLAHCSPC